MQLTTTFSIEGYRIKEYRGVRGIILRSPTISQGFFGGLKGIVGGNIGAIPKCANRPAPTRSIC